MQYIFKLLYTILFIFIIDVATAQTITVNSNPICNDNRLTTFSVDGTYDLSTQVLTWDLDEGSFADSTTIAQVLYLIDGKKTVTFFVDNVPKATKTVYVYSVKPDLYLDKITGCEPVDITYTTDFVTFEATAGLPDVQVSSVDLVLGDGARRTLTPAGYTHSYIAGEYEPSIIVTDELGCIGRVSKNIVIDPKPEALIVTNPLVASSCDKPFTVIFSDGSNSRNQANMSSWQWNFGQGQTSNQAGPASITYVNDGSYSVSLTVTNSNGCKDTDNLSVSLGSPKANFILEGVFSQDTLCGKVTFVNQSSTSEVTWDFSSLGIFNDFGKQDKVPLDLTGKTPGTYAITIKAEVVNNNVTCEATFTKNIVIPEIKADFDVMPDYGCSFPFKVTFTDNSINADEFEWHYDNGSSSNMVGQGTHDYAYTHTDIYDYSRRGGHKFYPYLIVKNKYGCESITEKLDSVKVFEPNARFMPDTMDGCAPLSVFFMDSINVDVDNNDVTSFTWDFGDGNIVTGPSLTQITHVYPNPGIYYVKLSITTALGCSDDSYLIPIRVGEPASAPLSAQLVNPNDAIICPGELIDIVIQPTPDPKFDMIHINSSSEALSSCFNDFKNYNGNVWFPHTVGMHTVDVSGIIDGCYTNTQPADVLTITMEGPIVRYMGYNIESCDSFKTIEFTPYLGSVDTLFITYTHTENVPVEIIIDTISRPVNGQMFTHKYNEVGDYEIKMRARNDNTSCPDYTDSFNIHLVDTSSAFDLVGTPCVGLDLLFRADQSPDPLSPYCHQGYAWKFSSTDFWKEIGLDSINNKFVNPGIQAVTLRRTDYHGCVAVTTKNIDITSFDAEIKRIPEFNCMPNWVVHAFDNTTHIYPIVKWKWIAGVETFYTDTINYADNFRPWGDDLHIKLIAEDAVGCIDTVDVIHKIYEVKAATQPFDLQLCKDEVLELEVLDSLPYNTYADYQWIFENGDTLFGLSVNIAFPDSGTYPMKMVAVGASGCTDTTDTFDIQVQLYPIPIIIVEEIDYGLSLELCAGDVVNFKDSTIYKGNAQVGIRTWDLDKPTGQTDNNPKVGFIYPVPGEKDIKLTIKTTFGCKATATRPITIVGPYAEAALIDSICIGDEVLFSFQNILSVNTFAIDFGDNSSELLTFDATGVNETSHSYETFPIVGNKFYPKISLKTSASGSTCQFSWSDSIYVHQVVAGFDRNTIGEPNLSDWTQCFEEGREQEFFNTSEGIDKWVFTYGDGTKDEGFSGVNPMPHTYLEPGTYSVTIKVKDDEFGCEDELSKDMVLLAEPVISVEDLMGCDDGIPLQLFVDGDISSTYLWTPATGLDDPTVQNPMATIFSTVNYNVLVTDVSGCVASAQVEVKILETPFLNEGLDCNVFGDTTLYIGEEIVLDLNVFQGAYNYTWTPTDYLSCSDCYNPVISPLESIIYTVRMRDTSVLECFDFENIICIELLKKSSVDVPTAFSPNGDGVNDIVYVDGWGIKELVSFRIYSRWGEVVFETTDIKAGWDGTYNGKLQEQDVYIYQVVAKFHAKEETESKQGNITLFR